MTKESATQGQFDLGRSIAEPVKKTPLVPPEFIRENSMPPYVTMQDILPWLREGHKIRDLIVLSSGR